MKRLDLEIALGDACADGMLEVVGHNDAGEPLYQETARAKAWREAGGKTWPPPASFMRGKKDGA